MNRKAQYFIVITVLMCIAVFSLLAIIQPRHSAQTSDMFDSLIDNCYTESSFAVNQAVKNSKNIFTAIDKFADDFKEYSKTTDKDFGFVYLATNMTGATRIGNRLENVTIRVTADSSATDVAAGEGFTVNADTVNIAVKTFAYNFNTTRAPNIQFLFWESKQGDIRVVQK
jgi:hypothetical protein